MRKLNHFNLAFVVAAITWISLPGCKENVKRLHLSNNDRFDRQNELIVLTRSLLEKKVGNIAKGKYVSIRSTDGKLLTVQFDDINTDGKWDEAVFLYSLPAGQKSDLDIALTDTPDSMTVAPVAHLRQMRKDPGDKFGAALEKDSVAAGQAPTDFQVQPLPPFLTEGPSWENDKVGFRLYFDVRNGKDIWGKTTAAMVLDSVGKDTSKNYHKRSAWGMDILKVGQSLGAGSLALKLSLPDGSDTLIRLGGANMGGIYYEKLADGPVRAVLKLRYPQWKLLDTLPPVSLTEEISIWGGQYFYQSKVLVSNAPGNATIVTGIVNLHSKESWRLDTAGCSVLYTYDKQSENNDQLGMAILLPASQVVSFGTTADSLTDIKNTYYVSGHIKKADPFVYRFYACWEPSDSRFASLPGFSSYLQNEAFLYGGSIHIR